MVSGVRTLVWGLDSHPNATRLGKRNFKIPEAGKPMSDTEDHEKPRAKRFNRIRVFYRLYRKRLIAGFVIISHVAGALTSVEAVMQTRTPQGATAWAVCLNLFPYGAVPAYWAFGHTEFDSYRAVRDLNQEKFTPIRNELNDSIDAAGLRAEVESPLEKMLESLGSLRFTEGNEATLLIDGQQTYDAMLEAIEGAEKYILFQTYILRSDETGNKFKEALLKKAAAGVKVRVLYDEIGSLGLEDAFRKELLAGGVETTMFSTNQSDGRKYQLNFRNHRKILVVDGEIGFTGGLNIGDEYLGKDDFLSPWRDTHIRVVGAAAKMLQLPFSEDWYWASGMVPEDLDWSVEGKNTGGGATVLCLPTGPADERETCGLFFLAAINSAEERLWIATPYFVPDMQIMSALKLAALRGVDVRIMVPDIIDSKLVRYSTHSYLDEMDKAGIATYRFEEGFSHQKVMLIDEGFSCIGSANMDNRSFRLNFEAILAVKDKKFASEVAKMLENDFANSRRIPKGNLATKPFLFRLASRVSKLLAPIQ